MRIALLTDIYKPARNGVVHHVALLKKTLEAKGQDVWLIVPGNGDYQDDEPQVIRIPGIPLSDTGFHLSAQLTKRARVILRQMDIVHAHHPFLSGSFGLFAANRYKIPLVFTNHTRLDLYVKNFLSLLPESVSDSALQASFNTFSQGCDALVAPSESIAQLMHSWAVQAKIVVIPNGIEIDRFTAPAKPVERAALNLPDDAVVALYVGRLSPEKSLDRLLRLFRYVALEDPYVHLVLVGDGTEMDALRSLAHELEIEPRIRFTGSVAYADMPNYMALGDFFVSASLSEVHPLTFIEAAAAGLPALGIRSTGVSDIIRDGKTGFIAEDNDLSFGLRFLRLAQDAELRQILHRQAKQHSRQFSAEHNARHLLELYKELVEQ